MRVRQDLALQVTEAIQAAQSAGALPEFEIPTIVIEKPREASYGDYACPSAMPMARLARMAPLKIAEAIVDHLPVVDYIDSASVAPPGFINFRLTTGFLQGQVEEIMALGQNYGSFPLGSGRRAGVEKRSG